MKYKILVTNEVPGYTILAKQVEEYLDKGWKLQGGISVSTTTSPEGLLTAVYAQAIIKDKS